MDRRTLAGVVVGAAGLALLAFGGLQALRAPKRTSPSAEALQAHVDALVAKGPAAEGHPEKERVREHLVATLQATGAQVKVLPFTEPIEALGTTWQLENVVASFRPEAKRRVLLGTHWDTRPWADEDADPAVRDRPIVGANDGISGTAVLLALAEELGRVPPPPGLGVDVVFFDGEEGPKGSDDYFLGSKALAETWFAVGVAQPEAGVVIDMVGKRGQKIRREQQSQTHARTVNDELFRGAKRLGLQSFQDAPGRFVTDDHVAWLRRGTPVILLIDMDYPEWHTQADRVDRLDPASLHDVLRALLAWVQQRGAATP